MLLANGGQIIRDNNYVIVTIIDQFRNWKIIVTIT